MPWSHSGGGDKSRLALPVRPGSAGHFISLVSFVPKSDGWAMDDWRGRWWAIIIFGFALAMVLNLPQFPARDWFNNLLDGTVGNIRFL
jgi:hypothetical protein